MDALAHLPEGAAADRPRFDAHIALALAHHHCCDIEQVIRHVDSAQEITEQHDAWEGNAAVAFIRASIARARKESPEAWLQQVVTQAAVNAIPGDVHWRQPRFCIDRLYSMLNMRSLGEMAPRVEQQAARCSVEHDLVSYVFLAVLAAAIYDSHGTPDKGTELLARISQGLAAQKQGRAAATLDWFQEILGA